MFLLLTHTAGTSVLQIIFLKLAEEKITLSLSSPQACMPNLLSQRPQPPSGKGATCTQGKLNYILPI